MEIPYDLIYKILCVFPLTTYRYISKRIYDEDEKSDLFVNSNPSTPLVLTYKPSLNTYNIYAKRGWWKTICFIDDGNEIHISENGEDYMRLFKKYFSDRVFVMKWVLRTCIPSNTSIYGIKWMNVNGDLGFMFSHPSTKKNQYEGKGKDCVIVATYTYQDGSYIVRCQKNEDRGDIPVEMSIFNAKGVMLGSW